MSVTETNSNRFGLNEFGGDAVWDDAPLPENVDRGDDLEPEVEEQPLAELPEEQVEVEEPEVEAEVEEPEAEVEDTGVEEQEAEDEGEEPGVEDAAPKKKDNPMVPRQRLNKEIQKRQQLEARIRELEAQANQPQQSQPTPAESRAAEVTFDDERVNQMFASVLDGDEAKAQDTFKELLQTFGQQLVEQIGSQTSEVAETTYARKQEITALQQAADEVVQEYPEFDNTSDDVDMGLLEEVLGLRDSFIANGMTAADALRRSARLVAMENGIESRKQASEQPSKPKVGRKPVDVKAQVAKAQQAPRRLQGDSGKNKEVSIDVMKMSDEQFAQMSREALARARGDIL